MSCQTGQSCRKWNVNLQIEVMGETAEDSRQGAARLVSNTNMSIRMSLHMSIHVHVHMSAHRAMSIQVSSFNQGLLPRIVGRRIQTATYMATADAAGVVMQFADDGAMERSDLTGTLAPTPNPTIPPTPNPTRLPTSVPTETPTEVPTAEPTEVPTTGTPRRVHAADKCEGASVARTCPCACLHRCLYACLYACLYVRPYACLYKQVYRAQGTAGVSRRMLAAVCAT